MSAALPDVLAGPLLRRLSPHRLVLWLAATRPLDMTLVLDPEASLDGAAQRYPLGGHSQRLRLGCHAHLYLIDVALDAPLPTDVRIAYDLEVVDAANVPRSLPEWAPWLCHDGQAYPGFVLAARHHRLMHGSCRKPHFDGPDGLVRADTWIGEHQAAPAEWPAWLLMTGDQVYVDDVAGPMLRAIHALIERLGLVDERLEGATVDDTQALYANADTYYRREALLPDVKSNAALRERFFGGVEKPVFTSANAHNHLVSFAEMIAMYCLVWSPTPWTLVAPFAPALDEKEAARYTEEQKVIEAFVAGLPQSARLLAHLPSLMIFDDHDVTDDWNLTADWERCAYGHPFSKRIIGNALLAYLLCQGWGNDPEAMNPLVHHAATLLTDDEARQMLDGEAQDALIERLLRHQGWEINVSGAPALIVLDTRTRRWRSERSPKRPSGLMDWEALMAMQHHLLKAPSAVIVSPAPMFGVKLIESVQKLFTLVGQPLVVDAENWMAHRGAASVLLQIWRHSKTPGNYVILSGDVHYSFAYDIVVRQRQNAPQLWQITSSGIKNAFPVTLLNVFDRLNRWLYAPWSPLNWFTKRRRLSVYPRDPEGAQAGERVWNGCGIGLVTLDEEGRPSDIRQLDARGGDVRFPLPDMPSG
ncbi:alkaline phosphatase family protein [Halomonas dongshanensis]|uniref:Alkaline phosphatase family protein n=1 Tax=Halomonas dongshanensis TaxID=2890835 RepID=A0ABT2EFT2_9GAMM|nr:alkaline phosphatase family protein [Halomonas dongshanensis]MCS2610435.1 alkaline phosphatase family protein [Halomonas dongshanensis]